MRIYTNDELKRFNDKIQKFKEEHTLISGEKIMVLNRQKLAVAFGAMVEDTYLGVKTYSVLVDPVDDTKRYTEFQNIMEQWSKWCSKNEYVDKKEIEHYENVAKTI
mgnify:FL=1